jgi:hypothetical protein
MVPPDSLSAWLQDQLRAIAMIMFLVVAASALLLKLAVYLRVARLSRERRNLTEQTFVEHLAMYKFDPSITGATYRYLQQVQGIRFPIRPSDLLDEDLGLDNQDQEETIADLLAELQREPSPGLRPTPLLTVEDLVRHLQASPRRIRGRAA